MYTLGIDTSNYATSLAVVENGSKEVVCAYKQLLSVGEGKLGLRQSDAVFAHVKALPSLMERVKNAVSLGEINFVGVSEKPRDLQGSYMPCFLAGMSAAKAFALGRGAHLYTTSHQAGHIMAALYATKIPLLIHEKCIFFHFSGGTSEMLLVHGSNVIKRLGASLDLYAGQAVDRLGAKLGLAFPSGICLTELAEQCTEKITPKSSVVGMDCHLSGLQNQCERLLQDGLPAAYVARYCLESIAKTAQGMLRAARCEYPNYPVVMAGGVMSSTVIKNYIQYNNDDVYFVPPEYSSDNAIGVALIAAEQGEQHG